MKEKYRKRFRKILLAEVGIEFKACMYFFAILFFYCVYRMIGGSLQADIPVMLEMIVTTYLMGYIQVYLLRDFEETDRPGRFECLAALGCSLVYLGISLLFSWFDRKLLWQVLFFLYIAGCYAMVFIISYIRRNWDTEELNRELERFKKQKDEK